MPESGHIPGVEHTYSANVPKVLIMESEFKESVVAYRAHLMEAEQKSQEQYDKAVLAMSGGGLAISFAFVKDIVGSTPVQQPCLLLLAWVSWGLSVTSVLFSFFFSQLALRKAIPQVDEQTVFVSRPGGWYDVATAALNCAGGVLFLVGVVFVVVFAYHNFGVAHGQ